LNSTKLRKYEAVPHPFVLHPAWEAGERTNSPVLEFTLIGKANSYLPYVLYAFMDAARRGLQRGPDMELTDVLQQASPGASEWGTIRAGAGPLQPLPLLSAAAPSMPAEIRLRFLTPLRLRSDDQYITPDRFRFAHLFSSLLGRASSLQYFHAEKPLDAEFAKLASSARGIEFKSVDVKWADWTRYSSRQKTNLQMGGLMGSATLTSSGLEEFWPYVWLGQFIHAGKGATMGLGRYSVEETSHLAA
jgi:hypothetical protein